MCNSEGCEERAEVLADETDQCARPWVTAERPCPECERQRGRSVGEAARVVPVERLEALADEWSTLPPSSSEWVRGHDAAIKGITRHLRTLIEDHATTVDPETTRSGFTGRDESDGTAPEAPEGEEAGERAREPQGGGSVERAVRVMDLAARDCATGNRWVSAHTFAQALADAGLLADPAEAEHRLVCDQCHATKAALREALRERDEAKDRHSKLYASFTRMSRDLRGQRNDAQADARAARQEGARLTEALREVRARVRYSHAPHCACGGCATVRVIDRALSDGGDR